MPTEESYCSPHLLRDPSSPELAGPAADIRNPIIIGAHLRLLDIRLSGRNLFFRQGVMVRYSSKRPPRLRSMKTLHILIVEDEPWVAMDLEMIIIKIVTATVLIEGSVAATKEALHEALDFAFLDVDVTNGKTFEMLLPGKRGNGCNGVRRNRRPTSFSNPPIRRSRLLRSIPRLRTAAP